MKTKLLLVLAVLMAIALGALAAYLPLSQREAELKRRLSTETAKSEALQKQVESLQKTVSTQITTQKQAALSDTKEGQVYFSSQVTRLNASSAQIDIYLKGDPKTTTDALDLVMTYPQTVHIKELRKGTAFTSYPRLLNQDNSVTVTGVAMPQGNTFAYGKVNEIYVTLVVEKDGMAPAAIELNTKDTQAYLNGTPVLDFTKSFKKIDL